MINTEKKLDFLNNSHIKLFSIGIGAINNPDDWNHIGNFLPFNMIYFKRGSNH